jgi:hypothetical protein
VPDSTCLCPRLNALWCASKDEADVVVMRRDATSVVRQSAELGLLWDVRRMS